LNRCDSKSRNVKPPSAMSVPVFLSLETKVVRKDIGLICNGKSKREQSD
jgi:hypothetical protein